MRFERRMWAYTPQGIKIQEYTFWQNRCLMGCGFSGLWEKCPCAGACSRQALGEEKKKGGREEGEEIPLPASKSRNRLYFALLFYAAGDCCISALLLCLRGKAVVYIYSKIYYVQALF